MRALLEDEEEETRRADTEITLGMKSLLGVFFGAVLVCGVFFGLGYSMGRGGKGSAVPASTAPANTPTSLSTSAKPTVVAEDEAATGGGTNTATQSEQGTDNAADTQQQTTSTTKPSAAQSTDSAYKYVATPNGPARLPANATRPAALTAVEAPPRTAKPSAGMPQAEPAVATPAIAAHAEQAALNTTPTSGSGSVMVQIAAVSRTEDASILVGALKKHGYSATMRTDTRDNLVHVQVGPFASRDEAKAMRSRLLADGYNAILK